VTASRSRPGCGTYRRRRGVTGWAGQLEPSGELIFNAVNLRCWEISSKSRLYLASSPGVLTKASVLMTKPALAPIR
jgi:hypothetical protein